MKYSSFDHLIQQLVIFMKFSFFCSNLNEKLNSYWADNIDDTNQIQIDKRLGALSCWNIHESVWWKDNINRSLLIKLMALPSIPCTLCFISCAQFFPYAADLNQMKIHISWKKKIEPILASVAIFGFIFFMIYTSIPKQMGKSSFIMLSESFFILNFLCSPTSATKTIMYYWNLTFGLALLECRLNVNSLWITVSFSIVNWLENYFIFFF